MEILVSQLKNQISMLTSYLEEERMRHKRTKLSLKESHATEIKKMKTDHEKQLNDLDRKHQNYINLIKSHHRAILKNLEKTLQRKMKTANDEYALLKAALRNYRDVAKCDLSKIWKEREEKFKLEHEDALSNAVRKVRAEMKQQFETDMENIKKEYELELKEHLRKILVQEKNQTGSENEMTVQCDSNAESDTFLSTEDAILASEVDSEYRQMENEDSLQGKRKVNVVKDKKYVTTLTEIMETFRESDSCETQKNCEKEITCSTSIKAEDGNQTEITDSTTSIERELVEFEIQETQSPVD